MTTSKKYALDLVDTGKAFIMSVGTAVFGGLKHMAESGTLQLDIKVISGFAMAGAVTYLGMKFFTPAHVTIPIANIDNPEPNYVISPVGKSVDGAVELPKPPVAIEQPKIDQPLPAVPIADINQAEVKQVTT